MTQSRAHLTIHESVFEMKALYYEQFKSPVTVATLPTPSPGPGEVLVRVQASGLCRSDWHGWMGHDSDVKPPHVPGHEMAGIIEAIGSGVQNWRLGARVTVPFCLGCGRCPQCSSGNQHVCDNYYQPGFTGWGSFAEYVTIPYAEHNLVVLPDEVSFEAGAVLGCRFMTSYRGLVAQGRLRGGEWVAVHGCGGVGLSAIMIASAMGASVVAVDIDDEKLAFAESLGANVKMNATSTDDVPAAIREVSGGGVHVSVDSLGSRATCRNSIECLRKRGRHVQIGLLAGKDSNPPLPMHLVMAYELEILGSHGMQAHQYPGMLQLITSGKLPLQKMVGDSLSLQEGARALMELDRFRGLGVRVVNSF